MRPRQRRARIGFRLAIVLACYGTAVAAQSPILELPLPPAPAVPAGIAPPPFRDAGPTLVDALDLEAVGDLELTARGRAELRQDDSTFFGEVLRFNREFGRIEGEGGVRMDQPGTRFSGSRLRFDTNDDTGMLVDPTFRIEGDTVGRGSGSLLEFLGRGRYRLRNGRFTTCEPGNESWYAEAEEIELDYEAERGRVRNGRLRLFDTTVLALPFGTFALENRRKTGFLAPFYTQSTRRGLEIGVPFYLNLAPERDLTLTPVYMTRRGEQLRSELRYMDARYRGELRYEYLPNDRLLNTSRTGVAFLHEHWFAPNFYGRFDFNRVSDSRYFVDLATGVRNVSIGNLQRRALLQYSGSAFGQPWSLTAQAQRFQTLQDPLAPVVTPYARLPQFNFWTQRNDVGGLLDATLPVEFVRFTHPTLVQGTRMSMTPTLAMPFLAPAGFFTPRIGLRYAGYDLDRQAPGQPDRDGVAVPFLTLDGGLVFERPLRWFGTQATQTFEPRIFYLNAAYRDQSRLPLFDTALSDFNFAQIFSENRFSGGDRFGDANDITVAATTRILGANGQESFRALVGQRFFMKNERVGLLPASALRSTDSSDLLLSVGGRFAQHWIFDGGLQYDVRNEVARRYSGAVRYSPELGKVLNASYRFNRDLLHQVDVSGQWPVRPGWFAVGRYNYSLRDSRLLEGLGGLEYNGGCWVFRAVFQRLQAATGITSTAFYVQLELNGFGSIGQNETVNFLRRNVPGYSPTNPTDPTQIPPSLRRPLPFEQVF